MTPSRSFLAAGLAVVLTAGPLVTGCVSPPEAPEQASAVARMQRGFQTSGRVKAVERKKRVLALKSSDGRFFQIQCGLEVSNFDQLRVGAEVTAEFHEIVELLSAADLAARSALTQGQKGLGAHPHVAETHAEVQAVDPARRRVTLAIPDLGSLTLVAGPEIQNLASLQPGTQVLARFAKAAAIHMAGSVRNK